MAFTHRLTVGPLFKFTPTTAWRWAGSVAVLLNTCNAAGAPPAASDSVLMAQIGDSYTNELFLAPFKYVEPTKNPASTVPSEAAKRPPRQQRVVDLSNAGDYANAGQEGLLLLKVEKPDEPLQLVIANSLAWSGRLREATKAYRGITQAPLLDDAKLGIANIERWQGHDEVAAPLLRQVLANNPNHVGALESLELAERELAPRTTLMTGRSSDSSQTDRTAASVKHSWRDHSGYKVYEVEVGAVRDELPGVKERQQDVTLRYSDLQLALKPTLELSLPTGSAQTLYGGLKFRLDDDRIQVDVGRVNWGKLVNNAGALRAGLSAAHVGVQAQRDYALGNASARVDYYNISDNNTVWSSDMKLVTSWRPFGSAIKPYFGIDTRQANFATPQYWSPADGSGTLYGGLQGDWSLDEWSVFGGMQLGAPLYGDAGKSWMLSGGAKRWVTRNVALSLNLWGMRSIRDGVEYRAQSANLFLEKVWR